METKTEKTPNTTPKEVKKESKYKDILQQIEKMTLVELNNFVKELQAHFDIDPASFVAASGNGNGKEEAKNDKVDVIINAVGTSKIALIKAIGKMTGKGLLDAKKMLDQLPLTIASQKSPEEAEKIKAELEPTGAEIKIK